MTTQFADLLVLAGQASQRAPIPIGPGYDTSLARADTALDAFIENSLYPFWVGKHCPASAFASRRSSFSDDGALQRRNAWYPPKSPAKLRRRAARSASVVNRDASALQVARAPPPRPRGPRGYDYDEINGVLFVSSRLRFPLRKTSKARKAPKPRRRTRKCYMCEDYFYPGGMVGVVCEDCDLEACERSAGCY